MRQSHATSHLIRSEPGNPTGNTQLTTAWQVHSAEPCLSQKYVKNIRKIIDSNIGRRRCLYSPGGGLVEPRKRGLQIHIPSVSSEVIKDLYFSFYFVFQIILFNMDIFY